MGHFLYDKIPNLDLVEIGRISSIEHSPVVNYSETYWDQNRYPIVSSFEEIKRDLKKIHKVNMIETLFEKNDNVHLSKENLVGDYKNLDKYYFLIDKLLK